MTRWECYIEEYLNDNGVLSAHLRDKKTNKKIVLEEIDPNGKLKLLRFLSAAKEHLDIMPTIFDRNGNDVVAVYGVKTKETKDIIVIDRYKDGGGYLFEDKYM